MITPPPSRRRRALPRSTLTPSAAPQGTRLGTARRRPRGRTRRCARRRPGSAGGRRRGRRGRPAPR
eukprot:6337004-Prymnesium_polylepis.1